LLDVSDIGPPHMLMLGDTLVHGCEVWELLFEVLLFEFGWRGPGREPTARTGVVGS